MPVLDSVDCGYIKNIFQSVMPSTIILFAGLILADPRGGLRSSVTSHVWKVYQKLLYFFQETFGKFADEYLPKSPLGLYGIANIAYFLVFTFRKFSCLLGYGFFTGFRVSNTVLV